MSKPAGVQLRRWFTYMVVLLVFVNIAAVGGSVLVNTTVKKVSQDYQPFEVATTKVEVQTLLAQRAMYEYLSEMSDSPRQAIAELETLGSLIDAAKAAAPSAEKAANLEELKTLAIQYRVAVEQLPAAMEGARDWSRMEEIRTTAVRYGGEVAKRAGELALWARDQIQHQASLATQHSTYAMITFICVFFASIFVLLALKHWWKRFQDLILGI